MQGLQFYNTINTRKYITYKNFCQHFFGMRKPLLLLVTKGVKKMKNHLCFIKLQNFLVLNFEIRVYIMPMFTIFATVAI